MKVESEERDAEASPKQAEEQEGGLVAEALVFVVPDEHELGINEREDERVGTD